jgi:alkanesulfonate monooxygenase SsuD/methylene tetrahydromethanopterin reductase-like flavin-dependent oxidoreductase (luciferase family)
LLSQTRTLRLGHLVLCANFRHPVLLGKMASTLDAISDGRLLLGLGSGSVEDEHRRAGFPWGTFADRTERFEETLDIVTRMLAGERVSFDGVHYAVNDVPNIPAPSQRPPVIVGGGGARTLELVAKYADWWNCPTYSLAELETKIGLLHGACARVGRDPATIRLSTESVLALAPSEREVAEVAARAERRFGGAGWGLHASEHIGTPESVVRRLREAVGMGVTFFVFFLHDRASRATLELLATEVVPHLNTGDRS